MSPIIVKETFPINFLYFRKEVKMDDLPALIPVAKKLFKEAVQLDLHVTGPIHWHYTGFTGDFSKSFTVEICLPVAEIPKAYDGPFNFKRTQTFRNVSMVHEGPWMQMTTSYGTMMKYIGDHKLSPTGVQRELYINADFEYPEANTTEIQIGVA